jgi:hypothetical protein
MAWDACSSGRPGHASCVRPAPANQRVTLIRLMDCRPLTHPWVTCSARLFLIPPPFEAWKPMDFHLPNDLKDPDAGG